MVLWVELLAKQLNASQKVWERFLSHMSAEPWNPVQVLIQCPTRLSGRCSSVCHVVVPMEHGSRAFLRHMSEFFGLLYEFSWMGEEKSLFLLRIYLL